ncbi:MAG: PAS domain S-box protein [Bacteroidetes bacterium]|nr:PAS domain S-box protein [Bacteroidota bacterium]
MERTTYQVLLIEERDADAQLIEEALLQCSLPCVVTHVRRLSDALEQTANISYDIVLLDLFLADSRGLDTFVAMRSHAPRLPMILLTDSASLDITSEAAKRGAQDMLDKDEISPAILGKTLLYAIEHKRHELQLHRQKEFYENLLQEANVWVEALDRGGNVILWNRGAEEISGYPSHKVMHSRRRWELLYPDEGLRERLMEEYKLSIREERSVENLETEIKTAYGSRRIISWNTNIIRGMDGQTAGCMFVGNDVTERRASEQAITRSEDRFRILADLTSDYVYSANFEEDGRITTKWVEGAFQQITGIPPEEVIEKPNAWIQVIHPDDWSDLVTMREDMREKQTVVFEYRIILKDGSTRWIRDHVFPITNERGEISGMHGAVRDITLQRETETSLLKEQEKLRGIIENAADGIALMNEEGRVIEWSPAMATITGIPRDEAIGTTHWDIQHRLALPEDLATRNVRSESRREIEEYLEAGTSPWLNRLFDRWIMRSDGSRRYIEMVSFPVRSSQGLLTGSVTRDITEVKLAELDLEEKNRQLQTLIQAIPDLVYFKDRDLRTIIANQAYADYIGHSIEEIVGKRDRELLPEDLAEQCEKSDSDVFERARPVRREEVSEQSGDAAKTYFETVKVPLLNTSGDVTGLVGVSRDITERKVAELLLEEQNMQLKERNQELDTYTHSVAHDLKNPLSLILGYAEMVQVEGEDLSSEELREYMGSILFNGRKMISIINALLLLANVRQENIQWEILDMKLIVGDALRRLHRLMQEQQAVISLPERWPEVRGYSAWIEEVWVNYIGNAVKHGGENVHIDIATEDEGDMVRFLVRDNGPGIPPDQQEDLFAPFVRLSQAKTEGHGLGLSIVRRIIEKIGGSVAVKSDPGRETVFSFTLPKAPAAERGTQSSP